MLYLPQISSNKRDPNIFLRFRAFFLHALVHFLLVMIWLFPYGFKAKLIAALFISTTHIAIDALRIYCEKHLFSRKDFTILKRKDVFSFFLGNRNAESARFITKYHQSWLGLNALDQGLHILMMILAIYLLKL